MWMRCVFRTEHNVTNCSVMEIFKTWFKNSYIYWRKPTFISYIYIYNKILLRYCIVTYCLVYSCRQSMVKVCVPCVMWRTLLFDDILIINLPWVRTLGIGRSAHFILQSSRQYLDTVYILLWCWREQWRGGQHSPRTYGICAAHLLCEWCSALDSYILSLECWDEFCAPMQWRLGGRKNLCRSWLGH